jgi:hypothetical protein
MPFFLYTLSLLPTLLYMTFALRTLSPFPQHLVYPVKLVYFSSSCKFHKCAMTYHPKPFPIFFFWISSRTLNTLLHLCTPSCVLNILTHCIFSNSKLSCFPPTAWRHTRTVPLKSAFLKSSYIFPLQYIQNILVHSAYPVLLHILSHASYAYPPTSCLAGYILHIRLQPGRCHSCCQKTPYCYTHHTAWEWVPGKHHELRIPLGCSRNLNCYHFVSPMILLIILGNLKNEEWYPRDTATSILW